MAIIDIIIPAYDEEKSLPLVLNDIPKDEVRNIIVCNNASKDQTGKIAEENGALVLYEPRKGYGSACLRGMKYIGDLPANEKPDIVVFLDADYSDHPEELKKVVEPIIEEEYDLVIGSRALGKMDKGSMQPQQIFGNWLATNLIRLFYNYRFTDLGPFRAIRYKSLLKLNMEDPNWGWTVRNASESSEV